MTDIETELSSIQRRVQQANAAKTRSEIEKENAMKKLSEAKEELKTEFEVTSIEDAEELLAKLRSEVQAEVEAAKAALEEAGV